MTDSRNKSLIIPINCNKEIFIQDRRNYKKPDWGFFGGGIKKGESVIEAAIREAEEELSVSLTDKDLIYIGSFEVVGGEQGSIRNFFLFETNKDDFQVLEGNGGCLGFSGQSK